MFTFQYSPSSFARYAFCFNPLRVADFSTHQSQATKEFLQNNKNLTQQSLNTILAVIHLAYKEMIYKKVVENLSQNLNLKQNVGKRERVEVYR